MLRRNWEDWLNEKDNPRKRRDRLHIMAEILNIAKEGVLKTQIMYRANLSFAQLNDYVSLLLELKLLKQNKENKKTSYKATERGMKFLDSYREIVGFLRKENVNCVKTRSTSASW